MQIARIRLAHFRSYDAFDWRPSSQLCVLYGENAAGKTSLLEAMFLCALGRSHRTRKDGELIRGGEEGGFVGLEIDTAGGTRRIECRLREKERRQIAIDGRTLARSGELLGCLRVVMFSPEDLKLIKGGPAERRRFMDMELSQLRPSYYYDLQRYNTALRQRNALLHETADPALIEPWEEQLAALGMGIIRAREEFLSRLALTAAKLHANLSSGKEDLRIVYQPGIAQKGELSAEKILAALRDSAERDAQRGFTSIGPHRDDIGVFIGGQDMRAFGSQGQQRTAALSLKLSQLELHREIADDPPVLLLDDVLSELDEGRQRMLAACIADCQTFLTCTDLAGLARLHMDQMQVYRITKGCKTPD